MSRHSRKLYACYNSAIDCFIPVYKSGRTLWAFASRFRAEANFTEELKLNATSHIIEISLKGVEISE